MPKKLLKRFMIAEDKLMHNKTLRYVSSSILSHNIWHLNRRSASRAVFIGLFWAFIPMPLQTVPSAFFCILWRANLPVTLALVWLTNPVTMPPILYGAYRIGSFLLGTPPLDFELEWEWVMKSFSQMWQPLLLGSIILSVSFASIGYTAIDLLWRWTTVRRWSKRKQARAEKDAHS